LRLADLAQDNSHAAGTNPFYISLADLMIILCVFFVLVVSMSTIDRGSFEKIRTGISGDTRGTLVELAEALRAEAKGQTGISIRLAPDGVRLDMESAALFDTGSAVLKVGNLQALTPVLRRILFTKYRIDIEGHTDDRPLYRVDDGEIDSNWSLSGKRASAVAHHLLSLGFTEDRLRVVGYAATRPKVLLEGTPDLEAARAQNRRVSLLVR
jgi:chemotaxis protein MotB